MSPRLRLPLLLLAIVALLAAAWAGLLRIGWPWPSTGDFLAAAHGPLFISGFLGTLICVERAVALGSPWAYLPALFTGLGGLLLFGNISWSYGILLTAVGSLGLVLLFGTILRGHLASYTILMAMGAVAWLVGNSLLVLGRPVHLAVPWWMAFLVLTIVGERLELNRILRLSGRTQALFTLAAGLFVAGIVLTLVDYGWGMRLAGMGMLFLALWLLVYDIARRNLHRSGLTRYIAVCLFSGHFWLGVSGLLSLAAGGVFAGPIYDAILHSLFLGFVFSMILGHAPIIFPAVLSRPLAYSALFYAPLILLHVSLVIRVAGDLMGLPAVRMWGGLLNALALLLFLANLAVALLRGRWEQTAAVASTPRQ